MDKNDGGPAFPQPLYDEEGFETNLIRGMCLRDYFAAKAIASLMRHKYHEIDTVRGQEAIAANAYGLADAMLKARES